MTTFCFEFIKNSNNNILGGDAQASNSMNVCAISREKTFDTYLDFLNYLDYEADFNIHTRLLLGPAWKGKRRRRKEKGRAVATW